MSDDKKPGEKQFGLKPIESQMLATYRDMYFSTISNFLSFVAMERLAYQVTPQTKFAVEGDMLRVWEEETMQTESPAQSSVDTDTNSAKGTK